ncbi:LysR family transcriptional regulator [Mycolicibacterium goodii]|uniref:Probable hydrogen peroxide-inducible genes activator n=1 Tax=Mycolicibacterium goodii TaxID=134601 RepID=A0A0K0XFG2_MYCGD|nr:LysR family transcriptional regulator [Mycolicibacterium goodii]
MLDLHLRRLDLFCAVVDEGGVTRAAERLHVAQPWVSAQLRVLESAVGSTLFVRSGRRLVLTEAGTRFYAWAKEVLAGSAQVQRDIQDLGSGSAGTLTVTSSMAIGTYLVPPVMSRLRLERPSADITVHISEPAAALRSVEIGEADFAVATWSDTFDLSALYAEKLWEEPIVLAASPHGPPDADEIDISEIADLPMVGPPADVAFERIVGDQLRAHGMPVVPYVIRLGHAEAIKRAVAANGWVCFASLYCIADDVAAGHLRVVGVRGARFVEGIGLFHRETKYFTPLQSAAVSALREAAEQRRTKPAKP